MGEGVLRGFIIGNGNPQRKVTRTVTKFLFVTGFYCSNLGDRRPGIELQGAVPRPTIERQQYAFLASSLP